MTRKKRSNTTSQQNAAVNVDLSAATAPRDIEGVQVLGERGLRVYDELYRSRVEWVTADLMLIVQAAQCIDLIVSLQATMLPGMAIIETKTTIKIHPAIDAISNQRRLFANLVRDAGLRQRDGAADNTKSPKPLARTSNTATTATAPASSFDDFLSDVLQ